MVPTRLSDRPLALSTSPLLPHRLLLVDDDPVLLETLGDVLRQEGFQVTTAESGEGAERLLAAAQPPFEMVLTDLVMPGKTGMDVLKKALEINPRCTVLILSGFGTVREATEAMERGAYGMLTKPLHLDHFRHMLRRLVERSELIAERDALLKNLQALERKVEELEATRGRMEMLADRIQPTDGGGDPLADLERLAGLKSRGMLNDDEFEGAKKALLSRWRA